ncbi:VOC family protein [Devosia rhizoryzae]|uniref:VOC family protein n=1 Tax=Devosia rhizoryzae TaxID=2774137 RepID=A0ABX7C7R4_9HYPH|nr:VOC family protein [Devosia rhizoryzae]QQR40310.1 VOC family protein [Devosia rhizoryzae]
MAITNILANMSCTDLARSAEWYRTFFERDADQNPMDGLLEWHYGAAGFQLYQGPDNAGHCTVTLVVDDVHAERERLTDFAPGEIQQANYVTVFQLRDPDGNLVVLAQPGHV